MNDEMKTRMIRMAADIFIPVGERQALLNSLYEMVEDAKAAKEMAIQAQNDLKAVKDGVTLLLSSLVVTAPIIEQIDENAEIAATESAIAADNTDELITSNAETNTVVGE